MSKRDKPKRKKGIAGIIWKMVSPLNENERFKRKFADTDVKILLIATDQRYMAMIKVKEGTIEVDDYKYDKATIKSLKKERDALFKATTEVLLKLAMGKIGIGGVAVKWITRKVGLRGIRKLIVLLKIFYMMDVKGE